MTSINTTPPNPNTLKAQRELNKFREAMHDLNLEDLSPSAPPSYTETILNQLISYDEDIIKEKDKVRKLASSDIPVLILGESGTGKELIAKALHGNRESKRFVAINCGAIPENLLESEFFGHKKGSFTGAVSDKRGLIEDADGGTLFLDEIGDIPYFMQAKLLRVLETKSFRKVGDVSQEFRVNFRLVSATNHLDLSIKNAHFRNDLYYRLAGSVIKLKPLRERDDRDIPIIIKSYLPNETLANNLIEESINHTWPGNVRELLWKIREYNCLNS